MKDLLTFIVSVGAGFVAFILVSRFFTFDLRSVIYVSLLAFAIFTPFFFFRKKSEADHIKQEDLLKRLIIILIGFLIGYFFSNLFFGAPKQGEPYESENLKMYESLIEKEQAGSLEFKQTIRERYCNDQNTKMMGDNLGSCSLIGDVKNRDTCLFCWGTLEVSPKNEEICNKIVDKTLLLECMSYNDFYITPIGH